MKNHLIRLYWDAEAIFCEYLTKLMPVNEKAKSHSLDNSLIISLTSFSKRFKTLHLTIKSLLNQSVAADKVILWLGDSDYKKITPALQNLADKHNRFEIRACEDVRSYTKLVHCLVAFPKSYIVTADDDVYYSKQWLENLVQNVTSEQRVISHRVHIPKYEDGKLAPYVNWEQNANRNADVLFGTGIGGVLYPPNTFTDEVLNKEVYMDICGSADDVWFFWMARLNKVPTVWSGYDFNVVNWHGTDKSGLARENVGRGANDVCIDNMIDKYGDVFSEFS